jgi:hypothetical protein
MGNHKNPMGEDEETNKISLIAREELQHDEFLKK